MAAARALHTVPPPTGPGDDSGSSRRRRRAPRSSSPSSPSAADNAGTPEVDDQELIATWQQVRKAMTAVDTRLACALSDADAPAALVHEALAALAAAPQRMLPMSTLAAGLGLSTGGCTKLVDRLVSAGFAARRHSQTDRRVIYAELTDAGVDHEHAGTAHYAQQLRLELGILGPEQVAQLRHICEQLTRQSDRTGDDPAAPTDQTAAAAHATTRSDIMGEPTTRYPRPRPRRVAADDQSNRRRGRRG